MTPNKPTIPAPPHPDDAPDLSAPEWTGKFAKALLASAPLEGVDLERPRDFGRDVHLVDENTPLLTEDDYQAALREIEQYFGQEPDFGTPEARRFDQLAEQIRRYEGTHWPISPTDADR